MFLCRELWLEFLIKISVKFIFFAVQQQQVQLFVSNCDYDDRKWDRPNPQNHGPGYVNKDFFGIDVVGLASTKAGPQKITSSKSPINTIVVLQVMTNGTERVFTAANFNNDGTRLATVRTTFPKTIPQILW